MLSSSAQKVQTVLQALGATCHVIELPESTRTAREAAQAVGCRVEQIAKSLVFKGKNTNTPILVIASGTNRVNETKLGGLVAEPIVKADADFVRQRTGFVIGGVPPVGHSKPLATFIDADLLHYSEIWAAAGTPNALFKLTPNDLQRITGGHVMSIK